MKILVTGSEGSLMQSVIPKLIEDNHSVIGVDNFSRYGEISRNRNYEFIKGDLTDIDFVNKIMPGVDYVIQGAAIIYGVMGFHAYPADILSKDVILHQNILWSALKNKVRKVIYISSSMVYERAEEVPSSELNVDEMKIPLTDYGLSKLVGERLSKAFSTQYGLEYTIWRPFNIITPYERAEKEPGFSHVFADFIDRIIIKKETPMRIIGDGNQIRCFTWIDDVSNAIAKFSFIEKSNNKTYNIGNPEPIKMIDLAKKIHQYAMSKGVVEKGNLNFSHIEAPKDDVMIRIPSIEKIQSEFNWSPKINLAQALEICIDEALRQN